MKSEKRGTTPNYISRTSSPPKKVVSSSRTTDGRSHLEVHDSCNKT